MKLNLDWQQSCQLASSLLKKPCFLSFTLLKPIRHCLVAWWVNAEPYLLKHTSATCWFPLSPVEAWPKALRFKSALLSALLWLLYIHIFWAAQGHLFIDCHCVFCGDLWWGHFDLVFISGQACELTTHCLLLYEWWVSCLLRWRYLSSSETERLFVACLCFFACLGTTAWKPSSLIRLKAVYCVSTIPSKSKTQP